MIVIFEALYTSDQMFLDDRSHLPIFQDVKVGIGPIAKVANRTSAVMIAIIIINLSFENVHAIPQTITSAMRIYL